MSVDKVFHSIVDKCSVIVDKTLCGFGENPLPFRYFAVKDGTSEYL